MVQYPLGLNPNQMMQTLRLRLLLLESDKKISMPIIYRRSDRLFRQKLRHEMRPRVFRLKREALVRETSIMRTIRHGAIQFVISPRWYRTTRYHPTNRNINLIPWIGNVFGERTMHTSFRDAPKAKVRGRETLRKIALTRCCHDNSQNFLAITL